MKEGCESDLKDGNPSKDNGPPEEDDEEVQLVRVCPSGPLLKFCDQLFESIIVVQNG